MPFDYINHRHLVHPTDRHDGLWAITEIVPRKQRITNCTSICFIQQSNNKSTSYNTTSNPPKTTSSSSPSPSSLETYLSLKKMYFTFTDIEQ